MLSICVTVLLEWTQKHDSNRSNKDDCLWLKTGWVKTRRSVQDANESKNGQAGRVRTGRSGIYYFIILILPILRM